MALATQLMIKKDLDNIEAYQHLYNGTSVEDVETWLNASSSGYTAEIFGWQGMLLIKKNDAAIVTIAPGNWLIRDGLGRIFDMQAPFMDAFWEPAV